MKTTITHIVDICPFVFTRFNIFQRISITYNYDNNCRDFAISQFVFSFRYGLGSLGGPGGLFGKRQVHHHSAASALL